MSAPSLYSEKYEERSSMAESSCQEWQHLKPASRSEADIIRRHRGLGQDSK